MFLPKTLMRRAVLPAVLVTFGALNTGALATDWPQYRGPTFDQHTPDAVRTDWSQNAPKEVWRVPMGESFGSFAVKGNRAYAFVKDGSEEFCVALDKNTGKEQWRRSCGRTILKEYQGGDGPRSTPTIDGDRIYLFGTFFQVTCLKAEDGSVAWSHDMAKEFEGQTGTNGINPWGQAASPIVEGDLVIVAGGGPRQTFMAFDKNTGSIVWKNGTEKVTHATPTPATLHGVRQILFLVQSGLVSLEPKTGKELWRQKFDWNVSTAASPVVGGKNGDVVYCSAAYNVGNAGFRIGKSADGKFSSKELYRLKRTNNGNHWSTPVHHDGYVYGLFGQNTRGSAPLECRDIETGEVKWSQPGFGTGGGLVLAGDTLVVQKDMGPITLVQPTPAGYKQIAEVPVFQIKNTREDKAWTMPVVADGKIYAKSNKEGVCLDAAAK